MVAQRLRNSEILIFCAAILFGLAWIAPLRLPDPLRNWNPVVQVHPEMDQTLRLIQVNGELALFLAVIGILILLGSALGQAFTSRRVDQLRRFIGAGAILGIWIVVTLLLVGPFYAFDERTRQIESGFYLIFSLVNLIFCVVLLVRAVFQSKPGERITRLVLIPAIGTTFFMTITLIATIVLVSQISSLAPQLSESQDVGLPFLVIGIVIMALAVASSGAASWRGWRA